MNTSREKGGFSMVLEIIGDRKPDKSGLTGKKPFEKIANPIKLARSNSKLLMFPSPFVILQQFLEFYAIPCYKINKLSNYLNSRRVNLIDDSLLINISYTLIE